MNVEIIAQAIGAPVPKTEYRFHPKRRWRFDYAWPDQKIAVEVHGGIHTRGRHTRGTGFEKDREKMNAAQLLGWKVLEVSTGQLEDGYALQVLEEALKE